MGLCCVVRSALVEMELTKQSQQRFNRFVCASSLIIRDTASRQVYIMHSCTIQCAEESLLPKPEKLQRFRSLLVWLYYVEFQCYLAVSALLDLSLAYQHGRAKGADRFSSKEEIRTSSDLFRISLCQLWLGYAIHFPSYKMGITTPLRVSESYSKTGEEA